VPRSVRVWTACAAPPAVVLLAFVPILSRPPSITSAMVVLDVPVPLPSSSLVLAVGGVGMTLSPQPSVVLIAVKHD